MIATLNKLTSQKKSTLFTGEMEHFSIDDWLDVFDNTGWYAIESGSFGVIEGVELLKKGCDDLAIPDYYMIDESEGCEFKFIDEHSSHIEIGHNEEMGFAIVHVTVD